MQITTDVFVFPFRDERWKSKLAVGTLIALLGTVFFPLLWLISGYGIATMRGAIREGLTKLPNWDDLGGMFIDGLKHTLITLVYTLPFTLIFGCLIAFVVLSMTGGPALMLSGDEITGALGGFGLMLGMFAGFAAFGVASLLALPLVFLSMIALARSVAQNRLSAAFEFGDVLKAARLGFGNFFFALVMWYVALFAVSTLSSMAIYTIIGCVIYPFLYAMVIVYSSVLQGALVGLAYRSTKEQVAERAKAKADLPAAVPSPALKDVGDMMPPAVLSTAISAPTPPPAPKAEDTQPEAEPLDPILMVTAVSEVTPPPAVIEEATAPDIAPSDTQIETGSMRDDLTLINGIGPTFAQRLYEAGITTFAALAARSAEDLRDITKARAISNQQAWIDEAKRRAGGG